MRYSLVRRWLPYSFGKVGGPVPAVVAGPADGGLDVEAEQAGQNCGERGVAGLPMPDSVLAEPAGQGKGLGRCTRTPPEAEILRVCSPTRIQGQAATFHGSSWLAGALGNSAGTAAACGGY